MQKTSPPTLHLHLYSPCGVYLLTSRKETWYVFATIVVVTD